MSSPRRSPATKWFIGLLLLALFVGACGGDDGDKSKTTAASTPAASSAAEDQDPIIIGGAVALSGFFTFADGPQNELMKYAVDDINKAGGVLGRKLQLEFSDTKSEPNEGPKAALDLIDKGADFITTSPDFDFGRPAAVIAQDKGLAVFAGAGSARFGVQGIGPLAFNVGIWAGTEGAVVSEFAYKEKGYRNAYVLLDDTIDYTRSVCKGFRASWEQQGGKIVGEDTFKNADSSIASQITRLKSADPQPDAIAICSYNPGQSSVIRQLRAAGIDTPLLGFDSMDGPQWLKAVPDLSDVYYCAYGSLFGDDPDEKVNELFDRYRAETGEEPSQSTALIGYSQVQVIAKGVELAGTTDGQAVAEKLETLRDFPTVLGPLTYTPDLHMTLKRAMRIMQIQDGKQSLVKVYEPERLPPLSF